MALRHSGNGNCGIIFHAVAVGNGSNKICTVDKIVAIHINGLLDLTAQRVVFVQRGASCRSHAAHQLLFRVVILRFCIAICIFRLVLAAKHVSINRLILRKCLLPIRTILKSLRIYCRACDRNLRTIFHCYNPCRVIRIDGLFRISDFIIGSTRISPSICCTITKSIDFRRKLTVHIFARRRNFVPVTSLHSHRRLVAGIVIGIKCRYAVTDSVADSLCQIVICVCCRNSVAVGFRFHAAATVGTRNG